MVLSGSLGPGPDEVAYKYSNYNITHKKSKTQNQKNVFFIADYKACRLSV